jgi:transposase-like protein
MNAYSEDLRKKIIDALRRGMTKSEAARSFRGESLLGQALRQAGRGGTLPRPEEAPRL